MRAALTSTRTQATAILLLMVLDGLLVFFGFDLHPHTTPALVLLLVFLAWVLAAILLTRFVRRLH